MVLDFTPKKDIYASDAEIDRRAAICLECDLKKDDRCLACRCVSLIKKIELKSKKCPRGRWEDD